MMKVPPRLIVGAQVLALIVIIVMGFMKMRQYLAMHDCLEQGHRWDHSHNVCDDR